MEELEEVDVVGLRAEVLLKEEVDGRLEEKRVVDCDGAHARETIPAVLSAARDGRIHHVVGNEEHCLQLDAGGSESRLRHRNGWTAGTHELDTPPEDGSAKVLVLAQRATEEDLRAVGDRDAAVQLAVRNVVVEILRRCVSMRAQA